MSENFITFSDIIRYMSKTNKQSLRHLHTWNLKPLANSDTDPQLLDKRHESMKQVEAFVNKWQSDDRYLSSPDILAQVLDELESLYRQTGLNGTEWYYFSLRSAQDQIDPKLKSRSRTVDEITTRLATQLQFFEIKLANISAEDQPTFLNHPKLSEYKHFLKRIFAFKPHQLTEPEEKIMALTSASARNAWIEMTSTLLSKEQRHLDNGEHKQALSLMEIISLSSSPQKHIRDQAAEHVHQIMAKYADIATEEINAILYHKKISDELRHFDRPDQSRHMSDDIETEVVDTLVSAVSNRFDVPQKFYKLKAALLGVDKLAYHERNVPLGQTEVEYPYEQASQLVGQTLTDLDDEFGHIYQRFLENGQFDVFPRKGKAGGAFCAHNLLTQPTYILLNHTNKLQDVLTIAHEVGHGIHNELAREKQNALNFGTPISTAEVASTFMEDFVLQRLLKNATENQKLQIGMMKLNDDISSIFRQIACYKFEQALHQQYRRSGYLSTQQIGQLFTEHMAAYMGPAVSMDEGSQNWWVYWSHIRNFFYVYSYASGLLISKSLQSQVKKDAANINKIKFFMASGQSDSPRQVFNQIGIDIASAKFWDQGLDEVEALLSDIERIAHTIKDKNQV